MGEAASWLEEHGVFNFAEVSSEVAEAFAGGNSQLVDLIELNAAELALVRTHSPQTFGRLPDAPRLEVPDVSFPIRVNDADLALAVLKTDCGPFFEHGPKSARGIEPWDVFLFAGDMSKLDWLSRTPRGRRFAAANLTGFVAQLQQAYEPFGPGLKRLAEIQGVLWLAKSTVLSGGPVWDVPWPLR